MNVLLVVATCSFFLWVFRSLLFWIWLLQSHDYQFSRVTTYLGKTMRGRQVWLSSFLAVKLATIIAFIPTIFDESLIASYHFLVTGILLIEAGIIFKEITTGNLKVPKLSFVVLFFITPTIFVITLLYYNPIIDIYVWFLLLERIIPFIVFTLLFALTFPGEIYWDIQVQNARRKMLNLQHCYVVAVVGDSKSEKKAIVDIAQQVFGKEEGIVKVSAKISSYRFIARTINKHVFHNTRMIITEFDSFNAGDIYQLGTVIMPSVIICASISGENIRQYQEYLSLLPESVPVLVNTTEISNKKLIKYVRQKSKKVNRKIIGYTLRDETTTSVSKDHVVISGVVQKKSITEFYMSLNSKNHHFITPLLGAYGALCSTPAIYLGYMSGMKTNEVKGILANLQPSPGQGIPYKLQNNAMIIDGTQAEEELAIASDLTYLKVFKGKKVIIYSPHEPLSDYTKQQLDMITKLIAQVADHLFITNKYAHRTIVKALSAENSNCIISYKSKQSVASYLKKNLLKKEDIALFLGEDSKPVLKYVLKRVH